MEPWRTALVHSDATHIWVRGHEIGSLMREGSFVSTLFLLHRGRTPSAAEARLLDAILTASADHGAGAPSCAASRIVATGNRQSLSAAVAAGVLAIGDEHGGAGSLCMEAIAALVRRGRAEALSVEEAARRHVAEEHHAGRRIPGLGHRIHSKDPRVEVLFDMARDLGMAGDGVAAMLALEAATRALIKPLPINIDGALAAVLYDLGFPPPAGKLMFIVGRVAGLTAEAMEEYTREKPMRIKIPVAYDGQAPAVTKEEDR